MQTKLTKDKNNPAQTQKNQKQPPQTRVACVGDSITEAPEYPKELQKLLGAKYAVSNFGVCGTTVSIDSYTAFIEQSAFEAAKAFKPNIVVVMLGTNDALSGIQEGDGKFVDDYLMLIDEFKMLKSSQIFGLCCLLRFLASLGKALIMLFP
jgi:lysophospholipase L1-like esterase